MCSLSLVYYRVQISLVVGTVVLRIPEHFLFCFVLFVFSVPGIPSAFSSLCTPVPQSTFAPPSSGRLVLKWGHVDHLFYSCLNCKHVLCTLSHWETFSAFVFLLPITGWDHVSVLSVLADPFGIDIGFFSFLLQAMDFFFLLLYSKLQGFFACAMV